VRQIFLSSVGAAGAARNYGENIPLTGQEQPDLWQALLRTQQAYAEFAQAWISELSGSKQAGHTAGQAPDEASTASGIEAADTAKPWFDAAQRFFPLPQLGNTFAAIPDALTNPADSNPFLSAFIQSPRQRCLLDGWQRENANYHQELKKYQAFCSEVFQESFQRISKHLENSQERAGERDLFDLWIDTAEEIYAEKTQDDNFETLIGNLINAMARVRHQYNLVSEEVSVVFNLPARSEIDKMNEKLMSVQNRISKLETHVESLNNQIEVVETETAAKKLPVKKIRKKRTSGTSIKKRIKTS